MASWIQQQAWACQHITKQQKFSFPQSNAAANRELRAASFPSGSDRSVGKPSVTSLGLQTIYATQAKQYCTKNICRFKRSNSRQCRWCCKTCLEGMLYSLGTWGSPWRSLNTREYRCKKQRSQNLKSHSCVPNAWAVAIQVCGNVQTWRFQI